MKINEKFRWLLIQIKTFLNLLKSPTFWKSLPRMIFIDLFWQGLGATVLFVLMIPAMMSGDVPIWLALLISVVMGIASQFITKTYDKVNPMRGLFYKIQKKSKK